MAVKTEIIKSWNRGKYLQMLCNLLQQTIATYFLPYLNGHIVHRAFLVIATVGV